MIDVLWSIICIIYYIEIPEMTAKMMISMQPKFLAKVKSSIPRRERSKLIVALLAKEIERRENELYLAAKELEDSVELKEEMEVWGNNFGGDGLDNV